MPSSNKTAARSKKSAASKSISVQQQSQKRLRRVKASAESEKMDAFPIVISALDASDVHEERNQIHQMSEANPSKAFELGVRILQEIVESIVNGVEASNIALAEINARGERLDRLNHENKSLLAALVTG